MLRFARTCALAIALAGGWLLACGYLPLEELSASDLAGPAGPEGGANDGAVDAGGDVVVSPDDAGDGGCPTCIPVFVSGVVGDDGNPGTADKPLKTIGKAIAVAAARGGKQEVHVAATQYAEKVTLVEGVSLVGGFECSALPCSWGREPIKNDTAILNTDHEGVLAPAGVTSKTRLDGFRVMGKGVDPPVVGSPSAAVTLRGGTPTITRCRILGVEPVSPATPPKRKVGIAVLGPSAGSTPAILENNAIGPGAGTEASIGVLFENASGQSGVANAVLRANTIRSGTAPLSVGVRAMSTGPGTVLQNNEIAAGTSNGTNLTFSGSWGITVSGAAIIDGNRINADLDLVGSCVLAPGAFFCGGGIQSISSTTVITNNVVFGVKGTQTCAVLLTEGEGGAGSVVLNGNTLDGGGDTGPKVSAALALAAGIGTNVTVGKVRNNILLGGKNLLRYAVYEVATPGKTAHPVAFTHNDLWRSLSGNSEDKPYRFWNGTDGAELDVTSLATAAVGATANLAVDPLLDATFHLKPGSPVVDKGTSTEAPAKDRDGDTRPRGIAVDMGADEAL